MRAEFSGGESTPHRVVLIRAAADRTWSGLRQSPALSFLRAAGIALLGASLLNACARRDAPEPASTVAVAAVPVPCIAEPAASDTVATIARFEQRAAAIERDSAQLHGTQTPISLGAGAEGLLHAWRAGPVWRRLRAEGQGAGFHTVDDYWFDNGVLLGARLEVQRPNRRPVVDRIWFRNNSLYRWTDGDGRVLNTESRSTQFEVRMMRARLDSLLQRLNNETQRSSR